MSCTWKEEEVISSPLEEEVTSSPLGNPAFTNHILIYKANLTSYRWFSGLDIPAEELPVLN